MLDDKGIDGVEVAPAAGFEEPEGLALAGEVGVVVMDPVEVEELVQEGAFERRKSSLLPKSVEGGS